MLAAAGLIRLDQKNEITEYLDESIMLPAVGQGALCIETRKNDDDIAFIMEKLDHPDTRACVTGERAFLKQIEGSCHIPVACFGKITGNEVVLTAIVASVDGKELIKEQIVSPMNEVKIHGQALADRVLEQGGKKILESLNSNDG